MKLLTTDQLDHVLRHCKVSTLKVNTETASLLYNCLPTAANPLTLKTGDEFLALLRGSYYTVLIISCREAA